MYGSTALSALATLGDYLHWLHLSTILTTMAVFPVAPDPSVGMNSTKRASIYARSSCICSRISFAVAFFLARPGTWLVVGWVPGARRSTK
jgi:hypothetical protein